MSNSTFENLLFKLGSLDQQRRALRLLGWTDTPALDAEYNTVMAALVLQYKP